MLRAWWWYIVAAWKLRGYEPQRVNLRALNSWVRQFPPYYRSDLLRLAASLTFVSHDETLTHLLALNARVVEDLANDGISLAQVIYVTTDTAGSSSGVMLNLLRDRANLERRGAVFLHSKDVEGIQAKTHQLSIGAIVYVDDFAGTGKQFLRSRQRVAQYAVGSFSEFFILPCICEEAAERIKGTGVSVRAGMTHKRLERPLLDACSAFPADAREAIVQLSCERWGKPKVSLGFEGLATAVVFHRTAPNTTPLILRGHLKQTPHFGLVPRYDDLDLG